MRSSSACVAWLRGRLAAPGGAEPAARLQRWRACVQGTGRGFAALTDQPALGQLWRAAPFAVVLGYDAPATARRCAMPRARCRAWWWRAWPMPCLRCRPQRCCCAGRGAPRLRYWDDKGEPHADWPPAQGLWRQLPSRITLGVDEEVIMVLVATSQGQAVAGAARARCDGCGQPWAARHEGAARQGHVGRSGWCSAVLCWWPRCGCWPWWRWWRVFGRN